MSTYNKMIKKCRIVACQVEYKAKIKKAALDNPDLPIKFIRDLLMTRAQDRNLAESFTFTHRRKTR